MWQSLFAEALTVFQEADDEVRGWVNWHCKSEIYGSGEEIPDRKGCTFLDRPG